MSRGRKTLRDEVVTERVVMPEEAGDRPLEQKVEKIRTRQKSYVMDLRIHSPASLGYLGIEGIDTAPALVRLARVKGLDMIALTDYSSGAFIDRVREAAKDSSVTVIPGFVIRCALPNCNDVILSCLFPEDFGTREIEGVLEALGIPRSAFGDRKHIVKIPFEEILSTIESKGGIALPSRMDKTPYRLSVLPTLVEQYGFRAFDLAYADSVKFFKTRWPKVKFHLFSFSNANALAQVGSRIAKLKMQDPGFAGIRAIIARQALGS